MEKETIFSKLNGKDYHYQLEKILETKSFSEDVKNLLLSCIYKIEAGYPDYQEVKRVVQKKKEYLEEIIEIIKNKCDNIEIVKEDKQHNRFEVDEIEKQIKLIHPNEKTVLYSIFEMDNKPVYVNEKYALVRNSLSALLNNGENCNKVEVLRDFNGWSWNTPVDELLDVTCNLVYQNFIYLLGIEVMKQWIHEEEGKDYLEIVRKELQEDYGEELTKEILGLINQIAILNHIRKNRKEKQYLLEEKQEAKQELERLTNKSALLDEISKRKKEILDEIKQVDTILNDKKLLEEEYVKRNKNLPEYNKIFSLTHLIEILTKKRRKLMNKMDEENKMLDPNYYVICKTELENKLELLKDIEDSEKALKQERKKIVELQKKFLECFRIKIERAKEKNEIIELIYMLRYYEFLYLNKKEQIRENAELRKMIKKTEKELLKKAIEEKAVAKFSDSEDENSNILETIFSTRIICLNNVFFEIKPENKMEIYDDEIFEKQILLSEIPIENKIIKRDKKIKVIS